LPDYYQFSADQNKVEQALNKLVSTRSGWPVATTASSRERFEVSEDKYQSRITLASGDDTLEKLYFGTSPGFCQLHVSRDDKQEVYSVKLSSHDYPVVSNNWLDHALVRPDSDVTSLEGPDFVLNKQGDEWTISKEESEVVKDEADKMLAAIESLT